MSEQDRLAMLVTETPRMRAVLTDENGVEFDAIAALRRIEALLERLLAGQAIKNEPADRS